MLLVLYLYEQLSMTEADSIGIYALYTSLVELGSILGGYLADRYFGIRNSIFFGGVMIAIGHVILSFFGDCENTILISLAFIIIGSTFFKTNIKTLLGLYYNENDPRRAKGFTAFYVGINIGALLATALCGNVAARYGWHAGFSLAAFGMFCGLLVLLCSNHILGNKGSSPANISIIHQFSLYAICISVIPVLVFMFKQKDIVFPLLPLVAIAVISSIAYQVKECTATEKKNMLTLLGLVGLFIIFFAFEELMGSMMMIFLERYVDHMVFGFSIHSSSMTLSNPLSIILIGPLVSRVISLNISRNIGIAFLFLTAGFLTLVIGISHTESGRLIPMIYPISCFGLIAIGELFIAPIVYSFCTEIAPSFCKSMLMGGVMIGQAYASLASGTIAQLVVGADHNQQTVGFYQYFFILAVIISLSIALLCGIMSKFSKTFCTSKP